MPEYVIIHNMINNLETKADYQIYIYGKNLFKMKFLTIYFKISENISFREYIDLIFQII